MCLHSAMTQRHLSAQLLDIDGDGRDRFFLALPVNMFHLKADMGALSRQQFYTVKLLGAVTCCDECNQLQW